MERATFIVAFIVEMSSTAETRSEDAQYKRSYVYFDKVQNALNNASDDDNYVVFNNVPRDGSCLYECVINALKHSPHYIKVAVKISIINLLGTLGLNGLIPKKDTHFVLTKQLLQTLMSAALILTTEGKNQIKFVVETINTEEFVNEFSISKLIFDTKKENKSTTDDDFMIKVFNTMSKNGTYADGMIIQMMYKFLGINVDIVTWHKNDKLTWVTSHLDTNSVYIPVLLDDHGEPHYTNISNNGQYVFYRIPPMQWISNKGLNVSHRESINLAKAAAEASNL